MERALDDIAEALQRAQDYGRRCTLLMGAGCSVTANIPLASGIVRDLQQKAPRVYERARTAGKGAEPSYAGCMAQLTAGERRDLLARYVAQARINTAHLAIAALMKQGYIARVLTTNFDPLVTRTCALLNLFPEVYDLSVSSPALYAADLALPAIFCLHGQGTWLELLPDDPLCRAQADRMASLLGAGQDEQMLLVVGYSGEKDPLFPHFLMPLSRFRYGLYWAVHKNSDPAPVVQESLLQMSKDAFVVRGHDADSLLGGLAQQLNCLRPEQFANPFAALEKSFKPLRSYAAVYSASRQEPSVNGNGSVHFAAPALQNSLPVVPSSPFCSSEERKQAANDLLMQGDYNPLIQLWYETEETDRSELAEMVSWAYVGQGNAFYQQAQQKELREKTDFLLTQAAMKYQSALAIYPARHEAAYNWGGALLLQARTAVGMERYRLLSEAEEKFLELEANRPGAGLYSLARISALRGDEEAARRWLLLQRKFGTPQSLEEAAYETDFAGIRDREWFKALGADANREDHSAYNDSRKRQVRA